MGIFTAKTQNDLASVQRQTGEAEAAIARLEAKLSAARLSAALSDDYEEADAITRDLGAANVRLDVLRRALRAAEAAERQRIAAAQTTAQRARLRALKAHLAALAKSASAFEAAVAELDGAWRGMVDAAESARALIAPQDREAFNAIWERPLQRMGEAELARVGREQKPGLPGSDSAALWAGVVPSSLPPISAEISRIVALYQSQYAASLSLPCESRNTSGEQACDEGAQGRAEAVLPPKEAKATDDVSHSCTSSVLPLVAEVRQEAAADPAPQGSLRSQVGNPHPEGSEEQAEFDEALAAIRRGSLPQLKKHQPKEAMTNAG